MIKHYVNGAKIGPLKIFWGKNHIQFRTKRHSAYINFKTGTRSWK